MYLYLSGLFVGCLILSNILAVKLFQIGSFVLPGAVVIYMVTYLVTDVIGEVYGKQAAKRTVRAGFLTQVVALLFIALIIYLPPADVFMHQEEFVLILGGGFRVAFASLLSYVVSQNIDVFIFHFFKDRHGKKKLWLRNNVSTMVSQLIDTIIFIVVSFYGLVPMSVLLGMIGAQYIVKFIIAALDTPAVYFLVKLARRKQMDKSDSSFHV